MLSLSFLTEEDLVQCTELLRKLFVQSYHNSFSTFDDQFVLSSLRTTIYNKTREVVIVCKSDGNLIGLIAGKAVNQLFNQKDLVAVEVAFFIDVDYKKHGVIRLLYGAFKHWAKLVGCSTIMMGKIKEHGKQEEYYMKRLR